MVESASAQYSFSDDVFFIGHSLVGHVPDMLNDILGDQGSAGSVDAQIVIGAPLRFIWDNPDRAQNGVNAPDVLPAGTTEVVVITEGIPLDANMRFNNTELYSANFYNLAIESNPTTRVYMYETWHSIWSGTDQQDDIPFKSNEDDIAWDVRLQNDLAKWESVVDSVNAQRADGAPEMLLIPVGQAMLAMYEAIQAGAVPGITDIQQLFTDDIHPNELGFYFVTMVQYATIYGADPDMVTEQLANRFGRDFEAPSPELADVMQDIAWEVVTNYDRSGVNSPMAPPDGETVTSNIGESDEVFLDLLGNSSDVDNDALSILDVNGAEVATMFNAASIDGRVGTALFSSTGELNFAFDTNDAFEDLARDQTDTVTLTYTITDGNNNTSTAQIEIIINGENDRPMIVSDDAFNPDKNSTEVGTVEAKDVDAGDVLAFSITGGANANLFEVDSDTGRLKFINALGDAGGENVYEIEVSVSDGALTDTQELTITVGNDPFPILGTEAADVLIGADGSQDISGLGGNDYINGMAGSDTMLGGLGDDRFYVDDTGDVTVEMEGEGYDVVYSLVSLKLADNVEAGMLMGAAAIDMTGNAEANWISGNSASNTLDGGAGRDRLIGDDGDDVLIGGHDNDVLEGGAGSDRFVFGVEDGINSILDFEIGVDKIDLTETGATFSELTFSDTIRGAVVRWIDTSDETGLVTLMDVTAESLQHTDFLTVVEELILG